MGVVPTGTVTFLFTDVEGHSRFWERYPDAMATALALHDEIMRSAILSHDGYVFSTAGDSFAAAFQATRDAVSAAVSAQRVLSSSGWPDGIDLRVRMGLHTGEARVERDGDYFGSEVIRAARVMSAAHGGQILTSGAVRALAADIEMVELGLAELKGTTATQLWQVVAPGLRSAFPPVKAVTERTHSLPRPRTTTVGRRQELDRVVEALGVRDIVTLTGPGGSGKTRLAIEAGRLWLENERQPVWFVDLSTVTDSNAIWSTVAEAMLLDRDAGDLRQAVLDAIGRRATLLIIDNCEHLLDAVSDVVERLVDANSELSVLATSREALSLDGEQVLRVRSLAAGPDGPAVELFVERARARNPLLTIDASERDTISRICAALDGLPLAIELAAGRADVMDPNEIEVQLADRFALLGGRRRGGRSRTLSATLDWSYDLLPDDERRIFEQLSVFAGGFNIDAVTAVTGCHPAEAVDLVHLMVEKSLVESEQHRSGRRFRMLETVRQYAQSKLAETGDAALLNDRHLGWVATLVSRYEELLGEDRHLEAMALINDDQHNLRAALDWAAASGKAHAGLDLIVCSDSWWRNTLNMTEALDRAADLYEPANDDLDPVLRVRALTSMAFFTTYIPGRADAGAAYAEASRAALAEIDDEVERLRLRIMSNITRVGKPDPDVGTELEELLAEANRLGTDDDLQLLHFLSVWHLDSDPETSLRYATQCQQESASRGNAVSVAHGHEVLANALTATGDLTGARSHLHDALRGYLDTNHVGCGMHCLESIAWWASAGPNSESARRLLGLAGAIRTSQQQQIHWLESHPHHAAISLCGAPDELDPTETDLDQAVELATHLLE